MSDGNKAAGQESIKGMVDDRHIGGSAYLSHYSPFYSCNKLVCKVKQYCKNDYCGSFFVFFVREISQKQRDNKCGVKHRLKDICASELCELSELVKQDASEIHFFKASRKQRCRKKYDDAGGRRQISVAFNEADIRGFEADIDCLRYKSSCNCKLTGKNCKQRNGLKDSAEYCGGYKFFFFLAYSEISDAFSLENNQHYHNGKAEKMCIEVFAENRQIGFQKKNIQTVEYQHYEIHRQKIGQSSSPGITHLLTPLIINALHYTTKQTFNQYHNKNLIPMQGHMGDGQNGFYIRGKAHESFSAKETYRCCGDKHRYRV